MIKYVLFDLDGTLTDPYEGISNCIIYALDKMHLPKNMDFKKFIGPPLAQSFEKFCNISPQQALYALELYRERFSRIGLFENKVYEGIEDMLDYLRQNNIRLGVATSKPTCFSLQILQKFGLAKYFDKIVGSELNGERVEKSQVISECISQLQIKQSDLQYTYMVGDRSFDMLGAKSGNIKSIGVNYGYAEVDELKLCNPDYIVQSVQELYDLFVNLIQKD